MRFLGSFGKISDIKMEVRRSGGESKELKWFGLF